MPRVSAGLLMYRRSAGTLQVLLVHPGGPFWAKKDLGAWTIPKGEVAEGEDHLQTARREFEEETSLLAKGPFLPLGSIRQKAGKLVHAWAFEGDCDPALVKSNSYEVEWPKHSGRWRTFPEVDRADWFSLDEARSKINEAQTGFLDALARTVGAGFAPPTP